MKESDFLHPNDPVWWKGGWGEEEPKLAEVESIERDADIMTQCGVPVDKLEWKYLRRYKTQKCPTGTELEAAVVNLRNGHWAYGWQLYPLKIWARTYDQPTPQELYADLKRTMADPEIERIEREYEDEEAWRKMHE